MDRKKIEEGVSLILEGIGEDTARSGLKETPARVAEFYEEMFSGLEITDDKLTAYLTPIEGEYHDEMVLVRDIPFHSICEHHLLPFFGHAHIAYIPGDGRMVGLGKLGRVLEMLSNRPQVQERLTTQLANIIEKCLKPKGTMVIISAEHLCMSMRGRKNIGTRTVTSAVRGLFRTRKSTRDEMLKLCK